MNTALSWIKAYVPDLDVTPQEYTDAMTLIGTKVEGYTCLDKNLEKIVVGQILKIERHPDADKLIICQVDVGNETIQIVTGAPNVKEGDKVPVVLDGGKVAGGHDGGPLPEDGIKIKKGKLRGIDSYGMMCSIEELGSSRDMYPLAPESGIYILPEDAPVGADAIEILGLHDTVFEYEITSNRVDCFSVVGIAREVAATFHKEFKPPVVTPTGNDEDVNDYIKVKVENTDLCPRYCARVVKNIKIGPSPKWMQRRLSSVGIRPINNLVDITNYVMEEYGQPMHAFDCSYLEGNEICVRRAHEGEKIVTLDEQEYTMSPANLVICDGVKPVALAGVMGGLNSEIRDTTESVMFEAAKFARDNVRKTARALGKSSDSSSRFEKGVDEYSTVLGMKRALHLIEKLGCGKVSSTHVDVNVGNSIEPQPMQVSIHKVNSVLGIEVPAEEIVRLMKNLNFNPTVDGDVLTLQVPAYREDMLPEGENDVERYPDVAEEVIRMYGYDHIKSTFMPSAQVTAGGYNKEQKGELALKRTLCTMGAYECMHYSFFSPSDLDLLKFPADAKERFAIQIMNPINIDLSLMRTTLAASMLNAISRNEKQGILDGRLFEVANIFIPKNLPLTEYPDERKTLCVGTFGAKESFYTMKGIANGIADSLDVAFTYEPIQKSFLHPYQAVKVLCEGEEIGYFGKVAYDIQDKLSMRASAYVMELDLEILSKWYDKKRTFIPLPKFAEEKRDLAFVMDKAITCGEIEDCIRKENKYVKEIKLFDIYEGGQIPEGKKSMAFSITFVPKDEAFDDARVQKFVDKICAKLNEEYGVELRA